MNEGKETVDEIIEKNKVCQEQQTQKGKMKKEKLKREKFIISI